MIPKIIHYCWFGCGEMPQSAKDCIASWHHYMPDWEYRFWNEDVFDVQGNAYVREAYAARKYAFVSDYVRLWALEREGGLYLDTDVLVFRPFEDLLNNKAFAGFEGSKHQPIGTCVMGSEPHGQWVAAMLEAYRDRHFVKLDGAIDMTTNVQFITSLMVAQGFRQDGSEQDCCGLHVYPVDYFSPRHTTGEYIRTKNTYCEHKGLASWNDQPNGCKYYLLHLLGPRLFARVIKLKRKLLG